MHFVGVWLLNSGNRIPCLYYRDTHQHRLGKGVRCNTWADAKISALAEECLSALSTCAEYKNLDVYCANVLRCAAERINAIVNLERHPFIEDEFLV